MPAAARATKPASPPPTPVAKTMSPLPARPKPPATTELAPAGPAISLKAADRISSPGDPAEREAEFTAKKIMRMPPPPSPGVTGHAGGINRAAEAANAKSAIAVQAHLNPSFLARSVLIHNRAARPQFTAIQRQGAGGPEATPGVVQEIQGSLTSGDPLPAEVRSFMEPRFRADFSGVRVHTDDKAVRLSTRLGARAFTFGKHIFFGRGQFRPNDREGAELLAHELTHTVQQREVVQRQAQDDPWWQRAGRAVGGAVSSVVEFGESVGWRMLEEFAPELVPIIRQGPVDWFKDKISNAVESVFNTLMAPVRSLTGIASSLVGHFTNLVAWVRLAAARIANGDCGAVTEAAEKIQQVFEGLAAPVIDRIKHLADRVKNFFSGLWDRFGAPVWQFLQRIGGAAWERIQQLGRWIWEKTAPIRRVLDRAWTWIKNKLGIGEGPEGQDGILQWVQRKAQSVWDEHIKPFYERYRTQILIVTGVLVMLSPAGPVIAIAAAIGGLAAGIRWIRQYLRNREAIVQQRGVLQGVIIPGILGAVNRVSGFLVEKARFISGKLTEVVGGLNQAMGAVAGSILGFAVGILRWIIDRFQELVAWAVQGLMGLANGVAEALDRLRVFLQPVLNVLGEIAQVVGNIMRLPMLLAGRLWNLIPACIRDPFINFFIPLILRQIAFFRELAATPEAWQQTRAQVMELIQQVFRNFDLLGAIRSAFRLVVRALRIPLELMGQLLEKAANAWDAVIAAPLRFIENALKAILQGIGRFIRNILSHLWFGVQGWLLNAVSESGVSPPSSWTDLRAVFGFVLDVMGISIGHVIDLIDRRVPGAGRPLRAAVRFLTGALEWLRIAIEQGPRGLWQHLVARLGNLGTMVLESAVGWVMTGVVANVSTRLTALAASAGLTSVLEAVKAVYSAIQTAIEYMPRILGILIRVFDTVTQIAAGVIGAAAEMVETGFRMAMPVVIGFLANYAGLGGIGGRIIEIIQDVRQRVDDAILWLIDRAIAAIRNVLNMIRRGVAAAADWLAEFRRPRGFQAGAESHTAWIGPDGRAMVASDPPSPARTAVARLQNRLNQTPAPSRPSGAATKIAQADAAVGVVETQMAQAGSATGRAAPAGLRAAWDALIVKLSEAYSLFGTQGEMDPFHVTAFNFRNASRYTGLARSRYENECRRQLRDQQAGINALKAGEWSANRARYTAVGRSASDAGNLEEYRSLLRSEIIRIRLQSLAAEGVPASQRQQLAEERANNLLGVRAILHIPDQVAGGPLLFPSGKPNAVSEYEIRIGLQGVNSAIGAGWGQKEADLAELERQAAQADPLSRMNVILSERFP